MPASSIRQWIPRCFGTPGKRIDVAVEAIKRTGDNLVIIGAGPENEKLRAMAGPNIRGWQPDAVLKEPNAGR